MEIRNKNCIVKLIVSGEKEEKEREEKFCSYWTKIISITGIFPVNKQDLGTRENFSSVEPY